MSRAAGLLVATLACALLAAPAARGQDRVPAPPLTDADYFTFADHVVTALEDSWSPAQSLYAARGWSTTIGNAAMLTVFATAAASGHAGPARNDARARLLARRLTDAPPYFTAPAPPRPDRMFHSPGWTSNVLGGYVDMDKSIDPKVAEALGLAYQARGVLGLDPDVVTRIQQEIHAVSHVAFFRYPRVRLNQINWNAELYAADRLVNGDPELLRHDYRRHVTAFTRGFSAPQIPGGSPNVGPSYRFTYQSNKPAGIARNLDSAEYANMTLQFEAFYQAALDAGMAPLPAEARRRLGGWTQRVLYGYWTHAGFLNWDTGWSYGRWMKGKTWAFAQQGLLAIATAPRFHRRPEEGAEAKWLFDRGLALFEHLGARDGRPWRPSPALFGIGARDERATRMFWARMAANAARAVAAGLGSRPATAPPPFYAYDADVGRLAVSTPSYSTAILVVNRSKVPYGGLDLARLYDGDGDPVGGTGGRPPAAFGIVVAARGGRPVLRTQTGRHRDPARPPLTLTASPRGRVTRQRRLATQPDAGPFHRLAVTGTRSAQGVRARSSYRFGARGIDVAWTVRRTERRSAARVVRLHLPTSGLDAAVTTRLRDGRVLRLRPGGAAVPLRTVRGFELRSRWGAYAARVRGPLHGSATLLAPVRQRANPLGGPTLELRLPRLRGRRPVVARLRLVPE